MPPSARAVGPCASSLVNLVLGVSRRHIGDLVTGGGAWLLEPSGDEPLVGVPQDPSWRSGPAGLAPAGGLDLSGSGTLPGHRPLLLEWRGEEVPGLPSASFSSLALRARPVGPWPSLGRHGVLWASASNSQHIVM